MKQFKIIIEKNSDGCVAYPLGIKGAVLGEGDTYVAANSGCQVSYSLLDRSIWQRNNGKRITCDRDFFSISRRGYLMSKFPVDASKRRVIRTFQFLGFRSIREREHIVIVR